MAEPGTLTLATCNAALADAARRAGVEVIPA